MNHVDPQRLDSECLQGFAVGILSPKVGNASARDGTKISGLEGAYLRSEKKYFGPYAKCIIQCTFKYIEVRQCRAYIQHGISITKGFRIFFGYRKKLRITKKIRNAGGAIRCATHASSPQASLKKLIQILHSCKICLNVLFYL